VKRGSTVIVAAKGSYTGKPRPAVVVQSDLFNPTHASVTICPITSDCVDAPMFRVTLIPGESNGLRTLSQVMVDKVVSVPKSSIVSEVGMCSDEELAVIGDALRLWLSLE
jgi:mRNA interferase MazF